MGPSPDRRKNLGDPVLTDPVAMLFSPATVLYDPESILRDLDYAFRMKKRGAGARRMQFLELIATIAPAIGAASNFRFSGPSINADAADPTGIKFQTRSGLVPFSGMSLGQQTTIAWALDLAWRLVRLYPDSKRPMCEPAIVLVDEIDLHLHPKWQQNLRGYLRQHFPATQFIATAHSPLMAQASLDANIVVFHETSGEITIWNDAERLLDWRLDQVVTALFGLSSGRGREIDALFDERDRLLDNPGRTAAETCCWRICKRGSRVSPHLIPLPTGQPWTSFAWPQRGSAKHRPEHDQGHATHVFARGPGHARRLQTRKDWRCLRRIPRHYRDGGKGFDASSGIYAHRSVKDELLAAQHRKCCYCERKILPPTSATWNTSGRRLASSGEGVKKLIKPGYYWLAYDWSNLLVSCGVCNTAWKQTYFPLRNERHRSRWHGDPIAGEHPMLVDPAAEDPRDHIRYAGDAPYALTQRGQATIDRLGLRRGDLREARKELLSTLTVLRDVTICLAPSDPARTTAETHLESVAEPTKEFSSMVIDFLASTSP